MAEGEGSDMSGKPPRVCIIGAGISGLCACRHLLRHGIRPTVFESMSEVGGVWRSNSVGITKLQTPSLAYQFSDFPWPDDTPPFATAKQVLGYLRSYALHFGVIGCITFDSTVLQLTRKDEDSPWKALVKLNNHTSQVFDFDFIILCMGRFGDVPHLPTFPPGKGPEVFRGKVMHSSEYCKLDAHHAVELLSGSKVVVVGFSKSALDTAAEVVLANRGTEDSPSSCTLLFRRPHWIVSGWTAFGVKFANLFGTRFSEMLVSNKPEQGVVSSFVSLLLWPMKWSASKLVELYLRWTFPLSKYGLVPSISYHEQLASCKVSIVPENFFDYVREGRLALCKSPNWHYTENGIRLENGKELEADLVILATGFKSEVKLKSILPGNYADALLGPSGVVPLYRGLVHPKLPDMAILGYQEDISNVRASEMGARWLAHFLSGKFKLPDTRTMEKSAEAWLRFMERASPYYERACVSTIRIWHSDELCRDIGWNPRRKGNWLRDMFSPYSNMDYRD